MRLRVYTIFNLLFIGLIFGQTIARLLRVKDDGAFTEEYIRF